MAQISEPALEPPPRKAGLRRGIKNLRRAYRTVFALVILVFGGWACLDAFRWYDLAHRSVTTEGRVLRKQTLVHPAGHEYRLEYAFTINDGERILNETSVATAVYDKVVEGQAIPVVYLADNAKVNHWLFDNDAARMHAMYLTIGHGVAALLAVVILRVMERPLAKELRLARRGVAAQGEVVSVGKPRGRRGIVKITYSFRTADGVVVTGSCNLPRRFPAHTLEPGSPMEILYDPRKPRIHKPRLALDHIEFGDVTRKKA